jgi:hypothetical protein
MRQDLNLELIGTVRPAVESCRGCLAGEGRSLGRLIWLFSHGHSRIVYLHVSAYQLRGLGKRVAMGWTYAVALCVVAAMVTDAMTTADVFGWRVKAVEGATSEVRCCYKRQGALVGTANE